MDYAARIWGLIIGAYIFIISGMIMNGNLIWTLLSMLLSFQIQQRHNIFLPIS